MDEIRSPSVAAPIRASFFPVPVADGCQRVIVREVGIQAFRHNSAERKANTAKSVADFEPVLDAFSRFLGSMQTNIWKLWGANQC
jgi:hypothetical protein